MNWGTEIVPGVTPGVLLLAFALPLLALANRTVRNAWRNPKMTLAVAWMYLGIVLILAQAGDTPVTGTQLVLAILGTFMIAIGFMGAIALTKIEAVHSYEAERGVKTPNNK